MSINLLLAYIDPMSGSLAVQFIIAALLSTGVIFRRTVAQPFVWIGKLLRRQRNANPTTSSQA